MTKKSNSLRTAIITAAAYKQKLTAYRSRFVRTAGGFVICAKCCETEYKKFAVDDLWLVVKDVVNRTDPYLFCDNCKNRIERTKLPAKERWKDISFG